MINLWAAVYQKNTKLKNTQNKQNYVYWNLNDIYVEKLIVNMFNFFPSNYMHGDDCSKLIN